MSVLPNRQRAIVLCRKHRLRNFGVQKGKTDDKHQNNGTLWIRRFSGILFGFCFRLRTDAILVPPIDFHWQFL